MCKQAFKEQAVAYGVQATYSGANNTMFIGGMMPRQNLLSEYVV